MIPTVGICAALETMLQKNIVSAKFTSIRDISQIYCELAHTSPSELDSVSIPEMVARVKEFFSAVGADPDPERAQFPYTPQRLTIPLLVQIETAVGTPLYDSAFDFGRIETQLICVEHGYGLSADTMCAIRNMPYPDYLADVWLPLYQQMYAALVPTEIENVEDLPGKNQFPESYN